MGILSGLWRSIGRRLYRVPAVVLFDGSCGFCRRTVGALVALDLFRTLVPIDALDANRVRSRGLGHLEPGALMEAIHVVVGERTWTGYEGCRVLAVRVPFLWPLLPFLYVWPIPTLGRRVYRHVADHRTCQPDPLSSRN